MQVYNCSLVHRERKKDHLINTHARTHATQTQQQRPAEPPTVTLVFSSSLYTVFSSLEVISWDESSRLLYGIPETFLIARRWYVQLVTSGQWDYFMRLLPDCSTLCMHACSVRRSISVTLFGHNSLLTPVYARSDFDFGHIVRMRFTCLFFSLDHGQFGLGHILDTQLTFFLVVITHWPLIPVY